MSSSNTVRMPADLVKKFIEVEHELEDWLLSQDKKFLEKMSRARRDDLRGKCISWDVAKRKLCLE
ncbi:MAG: hypothetical protein A2Z34_04055 [Planctomycetes bacterium RBG_16_59_8]|nr:MAG: hypothetical protein A2Z34_04055 [Planctomycetes bacterium RBG_16_59_8]